MFGFLKRKKTLGIFDLVLPITDIPDKLPNTPDFEIWEILYESQRAEGSSLSRGEALAIVREKRAPDRAQSVVDAYNMYGSFACWYPLLEHLAGDRLTLSDILAIHANILAGENHAGSFRTLPVFIGDIVPPDAAFVPSLVNDLCKKAENLPLLARAAFLHVGLFAIHPFRDGNKRTSRMLMNAVLALHGHGPVMIDAGNYDEYWEALEASRRKRSTEPFLSWLTEKKTRPVPGPQ